MTKTTIIAIIFLAVIMIASHEYTHYTIAKYFDCDVVEIKFFSISQQCHDIESRRYSNIAHSINEIVGYNIMPFILILTYLKMVK